MPATSAKQQRFMAMCSHDPKKAKGKCPSKKVAKEFSHGPMTSRSHNTPRSK